jgi:glycine betaine catabolism B
VPPTAQDVKYRIRDVTVPGAKLQRSTAWMGHITVKRGDRIDMQVELQEKIMESKDTFSFIFRPQKPVKWKAGQYIFYSIPHDNPDERGIERHFTISSAPHEGVIRLTSKFDPEGGSSFKKALYELRPGASIEAFDIKGKFTLEKHDKKYVFMAGGIGITPYRSILLDLVYNDASPDITMLYGSKDEDIVFKTVLEQLESENSWLDINYIIEPRFIDEDTVKRNVEDVYNSRFYVSGPLKMVTIMEDMLLDMNIDKKSIKSDYFPGYDDK